MALVQLSLDTLGNLDEGRARAVINSAITRAVMDLDDRGDDMKERVVTITLTMGRDAKSGKDRLYVKASAKLPSYRTHTTEAAPKRKGDGEIGLFFNAETNNPDQKVMFDSRDPKNPKLDEEQK